MTTPTTTPDTNAPFLSASILGLLRMLASGCPDGALSVAGRTHSGIDNGKQFMIPVVHVEDGFPPVLLAALEEECWSLFVSAAVRRTHGDDRLSRLGVLFATYRLPKVFLRSKWVLDPERLADAHHRIETFPFAPSAVVAGGSPIGGGGFTLTAIYALDKPLSVATDSEEQVALDVLRELARTLGAEMPAEDVRLVDLQLPVPGSVIREDEGRDRVTVSTLDVSRVYSFEQIRSAVSKGKNRGKNRDK